jgi:hypothetical protein
LYSLSFFSPCAIDDRSQIDEAGGCHLALPYPVANSFLGVGWGTVSSTPHPPRNLACHFRLPLSLYSGSSAMNRIFLCCYGLSCENKKARLPYICLDTSATWLSQ